MEEEQERELAPEIEAEQEKERPPAAFPEKHIVYWGVPTFIGNEIIDPKVTGYQLAFPSLQWTSAASHLNIITSSFTSGSSLFVSTDFARTIQLKKRTKNNQDGFLRPVQWVLSNLLEGADRRAALMIISPYEANQFFQSIASLKWVTLHMFTPHVNKGHPSLDALDLFTVPARKNLVTPESLITELLLFSGQLYFNSYSQYLGVCAFLGLGWKPADSDEVMGPDGFILRDAEGQTGGGSGFTASPVSFLKSLMALRRDAQSIDKTHVGDMLDNKQLLPGHFHDGDGQGGKARKADVSMRRCRTMRMWL